MRGSLPRGACSLKFHSGGREEGKNREGFGVSLVGAGSNSVCSDTYSSLCNGACSQEIGSYCCTDRYLGLVEVCGGGEDQGRGGCCMLSRAPLWTKNKGLCRGPFLLGGSHPALLVAEKGEGCCFCISPVKGPCAAIGD